MSTPPTDSELIDRLQECISLGDNGIPDLEYIKGYQSPELEDYLVDSAFTKYYLSERYNSQLLELPKSSQQLAKEFRDNYLGPYTEL